MPPSAPRSRRLLMWVLAGAGLLAAFALILVVILWRYPLNALEFAGRAALRVAGFEKTETASRSGRVVYFRAGSGPPLIFVHGANDQAGTWARVAPAFTRDYRVVVMDMPGHGDSDPQTGDLGMPDLVDGLEAIMEAEAGAGGATLVGNSLGGFLALGHAVRHPGTVGHVVLVNGAVNRGDSPAVAITLLPKTREEARGAMDALTSARTARLPDFVLDALVRRSVGSPLARLLAQPEGALQPYLFDDRLGQLTVPVTMLWGSDDRLLTVEYAERAAARMPDARLEVLPDCGHVPQRECPEQVLDHLRASLARVEGERTATRGRN
jgi:(E)-2-((N-methylformamido)methylene)succinate hydrolase